MKTKIVIAIVMVAIFIFSGIIYSLSASTTRITSGESETIDEPCSIEKTRAETTSQSPLNDDDSPELEVEVKIKNLFRGWYLIWTTVKNLEDERITLTTGLIAGGVEVKADIWPSNVIYRRPGVTTMMAYPFFLRPHQKKIICVGLWNMEWYPSAYVYIISGYLSSYEYEGKTYPYTWGNRIII